MADGISPLNTHDPVELWKRAASGPVVMQPSELVPINKTSLAERLSGQRPSLWTSLSQMSPSDQAIFMTRLTSNWPYAIERRALTWPLHAGILSNSLTASIIATRINADLFLLRAETPFFDAIRQCPKSPLFLGIYSSGAVLYALQQCFIVAGIYKEERPDTVSVLWSNTLCAVSSGIILPMFSLPYLSYYVLLKRNAERYPKISHLTDFLSLSWQSSKTILRILPALLAFQTSVAVACGLCLIWGRNKIFDSMDADPCLVRDTMISSQETISFIHKLDRIVKKIPFLSRLISD